jgi:hypothetical protein
MPTEAVNIPTDWSLTQVAPLLPCRLDLVSSPASYYYSLTAQTVLTIKVLVSSKLADFFTAWTQLLDGYLCLAPYTSRIGMCFRFNASAA